jgi:hypothetical protein
VRVVDSDIVGAQVVLGLAFGHFLAAEDYVLGPLMRVVSSRAER